MILFQWVTKKYIQMAIFATTISLINFPQSSANSLIDILKK